MGHTTRLHQVIRPQHAAQARAVETTNPRPAATAAPSPLVLLQQSIGNQAVGRLVQAKLKVGRPGDRFEREADRVADQVLRTPPANHAMTPARPARLQRLCAERGDDLRRQPQDEDEEVVAAKMRPGKVPHVTPQLDSRIRALGGGQPLPETTRAFFEPRFGWDFGGVRVHTDAAAAATTRALDARAYTHGSDIMYGAGERPGANLLTAHELTHVVQTTASIGSSVIRREPVGASSYETISPVWRVSGRDIVVVRMKADGRVFLFYRRTGWGEKGVGSAPPPRTWAPFDGLTAKEKLVRPAPGAASPIVEPYFEKNAYYRRYAAPELRGYGTQTNKDIADWLNRQNLARGERLDWREVQAKLGSYKPLAPVKPRARSVSGEIQPPRTGPGGAGAPPAAPPAKVTGSSGGTPAKASGRTPPASAPPAPQGTPTFGNLPQRQPAEGRIELKRIGDKWYEIRPGLRGRVLATHRYHFAVQDDRIWASRYGHVEAARGQRVAFAGDMHFTGDGSLVKWDNGSGSYKPAGHFATQAGLPLDKFEPTPPGPKKKVQLPVFQPERGQVLTPAGARGSVVRTGSTEAVPSGKTVHGEIVTPGGGAPSGGGSPATPRPKSVSPPTPAHSVSPPSSASTGGAKPKPSTLSASAAKKAAAKTEETAVKAETKSSPTTRKPPATVGAAAKAEETTTKALVKAEGKTGARLTSRAGRLGLSLLLPGPEDAIMLMVDFAGSYREAWDIIEQRNTRRGIAFGIAAGMMGLNWGWVQQNLWRRFATPDVATHVIAAVGKAERAFNDGLMRGHKYGAGHPQGMKDRILAEAYTILAREGYETDEEGLFTIDTVARVARVLMPIADDFLRQAAERRQAREKREKAQRRKEAREWGPVGNKI